MADVFEIDRIEIDNFDVFISAIKEEIKKHREEQDASD